MADKRVFVKGQDVFVFSGAHEGWGRGVKNRVEKWEPAVVVTPDIQVPTYMWKRDGTRQMRQEVEVAITFEHRDLFDGTGEMKKNTVLRRVPNARNRIRAPHEMDDIREKNAAIKAQQEERNDRALAIRTAEFERLTGEILAIVEEGNDTRFRIRKLLMEDTVMSASRRFRLQREERGK